MELDGKIIGIISNDYIEEDYSGKKVEEIITYKMQDALKMVKLDESIKSVLFDDLSSRDKNKVILASHLHDKEIRLVNFSKGMIKKDLEYSSTLFKRIANYGRKIILVDKNLEMFLNCVDHIYIIEDEKIVYETKNLFDNILTKYVDVPKIVEFINTSSKNGIRLDYYTELDELLKAIYRIKSWDI